jgi:heme exporter protein C
MSEAARMASDPAWRADDPAVSQAALRATGVLAVALGAVWLVTVWNAPVDAFQGPIQKILYLHAPCAFAAYLGFAMTALFGGLYLWRGEERFDRFAVASAGVGVVFCTLVLLTGPIWAKGTWGRWWSWDLRLTLTLLLYLIYLAYILLRSFTEGSERTARFAAVYGIAGLLVIPLNYFAIDLAGGRAIHPENLQRGSLGAGMGWPFLLGVLVAFATFAHLWLRRVDVAALRGRQASLEAEEASAFAPGATSWDT